MKASLKRLFGQKEGPLASIKRFFARKDVRTVCMVVLFSAVAAHAEKAQEIATAVSAGGKEWVFWAMRILGGLMAIGGLVQVVNGFTGNEEGYGKVAKLGTGLLLMAIGIYVLTSTPDLYKSLGLENLFKASVT